jgi:hypothetical protein
MLSLCAGAAMAMFASPTFGQVITTTVVNDSFADGNRFVTGPLQADFYASSSSSAIEDDVDDGIGANMIGLVSGSSGRQIHALFATQTLAMTGDTIFASLTFTTPATVAATNEDIRIGLFDHLGRNTPTQLAQDTSYSTASPNPDYSGLPGFYSEIDVESNDPGTDFNIRESNPSTSGRLLATSGGFTSLGSSPDVGYTIVPNTTYTVSLTLERLLNGDIDVTTQLGGASDTETIIAPGSYDFGLLALGASSGAFGSSNTPGDADNGIDITNFTLQFSTEATAVPEPSSAALLIGGLASLGLVRRRK